MRDPRLPTSPKLTLPKLDARPGPAVRIDDEAARSLVGATLRAHAAAQRRKRRAPVWTYAAVASLLLLTSAAVSAVVAWPPVPGELPSAQHVARLRPLTPPVFPAVPELADAPPPVPAIAPDPVRQVRAHSNAAAMDGLARANELRSAKRWRQAAEAYERVARQHPRTPEAYAALVAAGALRREKLGDPRGAVASFTRALASHPQGPLAEEARAGLAEAHRARGDEVREARAWRDLLRHHPTSVLAPHANERLARLGARLAP